MSRKNPGRSLLSNDDAEGTLLGKAGEWPSRSLWEEKRPGAFPEPQLTWSRGNGWCVAERAELLAMESRALALHGRVAQEPRASRENPDLTEQLLVRGAACTL